LAPVVLTALLAGIVTLVIAARPLSEAKAAGDPPPATAPASGPSPARAADKSPAETGRLTPAQEAETLAFLSERRASYYEKMKALKTEDPNGYVQAMSRMYSAMKRWKQMPQTLQDATNNERDAQLRIMAVIKQMRQADDAGKQRLEAELERAVSEHFQAEQMLRELRLQYLDQQLRDLRDQLGQQEFQRNTIIAERIARWKNAIEPVDPATRPAGATAKADGK
jgi:ATP-dependent Lon protease